MGNKQPAPRTSMRSLPRVFDAARVVFGSIVPDCHPERGMTGYGVFFGPGAFVGSFVGGFGCESVFTRNGTPGESPAGVVNDASALRSRSLRAVAAAICFASEKTF